MGMVNHGYMYPIDQPIRNFANAFGSINTNYHLPTSNLPPEFRLESSSRLQLPQIQQPHSQVYQLGHFLFCFSIYISRICFSYVKVYNDIELTAFFYFYALHNLYIYVCVCSTGTT